MTVNLVWITPSCEQIITDCARVSNPSNQGKDGARLIRYLVEHRHWSPFEMASACVEIGTSRAIAQQILRHRSFSFQEFSQRYAAATSVEPIQLRRQAEKNRQSSAEVLNDPRLTEIVEVAVAVAQTAYHDLLDAGVAKECARMVLPAATGTRLYMVGTIRSWVHYLDLRTSPDTQLEHREVALAIATVLRPQLPTVAEALGWAA
jgi:thymidylate synthase (FAD)